MLDSVAKETSTVANDGGVNTLTLLPSHKSERMKLRSWLYSPQARGLVQAVACRLYVLLETLL